MDLHEYDNCNGNLKLANDTYPLVGAALDKLQVKNKGTMDNTELASMKTTKTELNFRITNCINGLGQWKKANPGLRDPPGITRARLETTAPRIPRLGLRRKCLQSLTMRSVTYRPRTS